MDRLPTLHPDLKYKDDTACYIMSAAWPTLGERKQTACCIAISNVGAIPNRLEVTCKAPISDFDVTYQFD
jgi:hypothetical protein